MAFDPDAYLADPQQKEFDPDSYLNASAAFDPDAYLGESQKQEFVPVGRMSDRQFADWQAMGDMIQRDKLDPMAGPRNVQEFIASPEGQVLANEYPSRGQQPAQTPEGFPAGLTVNESGRPVYGNVKGANVPSTDAELQSLGLPSFDVIFRKGQRWDTLNMRINEQYQQLLKDKGVKRAFKSKSAREKYALESARAMYPVSQDMAMSGIEQQIYEKYKPALAGWGKLPGETDDQQRARQIRMAENEQRLKLYREGYAAALEWSSPEDLKHYGDLIRKAEDDMPSFEREAQQHQIEAVKLAEQIPAFMVAGKVIGANATVANIAERMKAVPGLRRLAPALERLSKTRIAPAIDRTLTGAASLGTVGAVSQPDDPVQGATQGAAFGGSLGLFAVNPLAGATAMTILNAAHRIDAGEDPESAVPKAAIDTAFILAMFRGGHEPRNKWVEKALSTTREIGRSAHESQQAFIKEMAAKARKGDPRAKEWLRDNVVLGRTHSQSTKARPAAAPAQSRPPPPETPAVRTGAEAPVFGTRGQQFDAQYAVVPRSAIMASHDPITFQRNPNYPLGNSRDYSNPAEQEKVLSIRNAFSPARHITDSPDAAVGPSMVAKIIDADGNATLSVLGGNNREMVISLLSEEQKQQLRDYTNQRVDRFGVDPLGSDDALVRYMGEFDLRKPGERAKVQGIIDSLNPSPGKVQNIAEMSKVDAANNVPLDELAGIPAEVTPVEAQQFIARAIATGGLDRNLRSQIAENPQQAVEYVKRLQVQGATRSDILADFSAGNDRKGTAARGLIDAAIPALIEMRLKGADELAGAFVRSLETVVNDFNKGGKLTSALAQAAQQTDFDPKYAIVNDVAASMKDVVATNARGAIDTDASVENFQQLWTRIHDTMKQWSAEADMFGPARTPEEAVRDLLSSEPASMVAEGSANNEGNVNTGVDESSLTYEGDNSNGEVSGKEIESYLEARNVGKRPEAVAEIGNALGQISDSGQSRPYQQLGLWETPRPDAHRPGRRPQASLRPEEKKHLTRLYFEALESGNTEALQKYYDQAQSNTVSAIIRELYKGPVMSWPVKGAIVGSPADVFALAFALRSPYQESLKVLYLDAKSRVVDSRIVSLGTLNSALASPQMVFGDVPQGADGVILSHNHPSGDPTPSSEDVKLTKQLGIAAHHVGLSVVDHVVTNGRKFFSLREGGLYQVPDRAGKAAGVPSGMKKLEFVPTQPPKDGLSPWEAVPLEDQKMITTPANLREVAATLRQASPDHGHMIMLGTKNKIVAVHRFHKDDFLKGNLVGEAMREQAGRAAIIDLPIRVSSDAIKQAKRHVQEFSDASIQLLDVVVDGEPEKTSPYESLREAGLVSFRESGRMVMREDPYQVMETEDLFYGMEQMAEAGKDIPDNRFKLLMGRIAGVVDTEAPFRALGAPETGFQIKNLYSRYQMGVEKAMEQVEHVNKLLVDPRDAADVFFAASNPKHVARMTPEAAERIKPAVDYVRKVFDEYGAELKQWGVLRELWPQSAINREQAELQELRDRMTALNKGELDAELRAANTPRIDARKKLQGDIDKVKDRLRKLDQMKYVHLPYRMWVQNKMDTDPEGYQTILSGTFSSILGRETIDPYDLVESGKLRASNVDVRDALASYIRYVEAQRGQHLIKVAAQKEGLVKPVREAPDGWSLMDPRKFPIWAGLRVKPSFANALERNYADVNRYQTRLERFCSFVKMMQFYNPIIMPMYDTYQGAALTQGLGTFETVNAVKAVTRKTQDYWDAYENGLFSAPSKGSYRDFVMKLESTKAGKGFKGYLEAQVKQFVDASLKAGQGERVAAAAKDVALLVPRLLDATYRLSWSSAWALDHTIRMASYLHLRRRGFGPRTAAQLAAEAHADYAGVPSRTRRVLNMTFFTPTFQIAMLKETGKLVWGSTRLGPDVIRAAGKKIPPGQAGKSFQRLLTLLFAGALLMARDWIMEQLGWKREQYARKYVKDVTDQKGEDKEAVVTFSDPLNLPIKYYYIFGNVQPGETRLAHIAKYGRFSLHPNWNIASMVLQNERPDGTPITNPWKSEMEQAVDYSRFVSGQIFRMYGELLDSADDTTKAETFEALREQGHPLDKFMQPVAFGYLRDPDEKRISRRAIQISSDFLHYLIEKPPTSQQQLDEMYERVTRQLDELYKEAVTVENQMDIGRQAMKLQIMKGQVNQQLESNKRIGVDQQEVLREAREIMGIKLPSIKQSMTEDQLTSPATTNSISPRVLMGQ